MSTRITRSSAYLMSYCTLTENKQDIELTSCKTIVKKCSHSDTQGTEKRRPQKHFETGGHNRSVMESTPFDKQVDISIYDYNEDGDGDQHSQLNSKDRIAETNNERKCANCLAIFENPLELLRHSRSCQSPRRILPLEEIEKYFDSPNKNYCPICEKRIKTRNFRSVFIKHLLVHTNGPLHECNICKKKFRRRDHMRAHQRRHIVIAPIHKG